MTKSFETVKVAEGIYAFIAPEPKTALVSGNSIAVIGDDGVLVVDSGHFPTLTRQMIAEIRKMTDKPVRVLVNTHWHYDHLMGNAVYRDEFPGVVILTHTFTRQMMESEVPKYVVRQPRGLPKMAQKMREALAQGKDLQGKTLEGFDLEYQKLLIEDIDADLPEAAQFRYAAPTIGFEQGVTVYLGKREVKVMNLGRGNTAGDAVVYVPDAKVLITGDVLVNPTPYSYGSYLTEWTQVLKKLATMDTTAIVPGHGPVERDHEYINLVISLLESVTAQVHAAAKQGLNLEETRKKVDLSSFSKRLAGDNPWRQGAFRVAFLESAIERAYQEEQFQRSEEFQP